MYDELIKRLRAQAVYLPEKFSKNAELLDVLMKAADAIEELSKDIDSMNEANIALYGALPKAPHGRLIDADAFLALVNDSTILSDFPKCIINQLIRGEPTVIEAEEGE